MAYPVDEKLRLLGAVAFKMVERQLTELPKEKLPALIPSSFEVIWEDMLLEIEPTQLFYCRDNVYRFLHQLFQEYLAARWYLQYVPENLADVRRRLALRSWWDTFGMLLSFAHGSEQRVMTIIEEALKFDPVLAARFLGACEGLDPTLESKFVEDQRDKLLAPQVPQFDQKSACAALTELNALDALLGILTDSGTSPELRIELLHAVRKTVGSSSMTDDPSLESRLASSLRRVLDSAEPRAGNSGELMLATISAARELKLNEVLYDAVNRIVLWDGLETQTRVRAWEIIRHADIPLRSGQELDLRSLCLERLAELREILQQTQINQEVRRLNREREEILELLAYPEYLDILLRERFSLGIEKSGARSLDQALQRSGAPPSSHKEAWRILQERPQKLEETEKSWLAAVREGPLPEAQAAAHRLSAGVRHLDVGDLKEVWITSFPSDRLSLLACVLRPLRSEAVIGPVEGLLKSLLPRIETYEEYEGFASLALAFRDLAGQRGHRLLAQAGSFLFTERTQQRHAQYPLRCIHNPVHLVDDDYQHMLRAGGEEARAAVYRLQADAPELLAGERRIPSNPSEATIGSFIRFLDSETHPKWQGFSARAACTLGATSALHRLLELAEDPGLATRKLTYYLPALGVVHERHLANILRAIGYLTRIAIDQGREKEVEDAVVYLRRRLESLSPTEDPRILNGLTTALCFVGDWEPLLESIEVGDKLMLRTGPQILDTWIPQPPDGIVARHRAATWIARRLDQGSGLSVDATSALKTVKERMELSLGIVLLLDENKNPLVSASDVARIVISEQDSKLEQELRKSIGREGENAATLGEYALFLKNRRKDYTAANAMYRKALVLDPDNGQVLANFAFFLGSAWNEDDEAEELYQRALRLRPTDSTLVGNFASFLEHKRQNPVLAEEYYQRALALAPGDRNLHANFACLLISTERYRKAAEHLRVAWLGWRVHSKLGNATTGLLRVVGKILFLHSVLSELTGSNPEAALRRLKSLLESAFVTHPWPLGALIDVLKQKLHQDKFLFYATLSDVMSDERKLPAMASFPDWVKLRPIFWRSLWSEMDQS